jgi:hypothetical protein
MQEDAKAMHATSDVPSDVVKNHACTFRRPVDGRSWKHLYF